MHRLFPAACLLCLVLARPAVGGWTIEFTCHNESSASYSFRVRASVEGESVRYDVIEGNHPLFNPKLTVISRQGGQTLIVLDHRLRTYFMRDARTMAGPLSTWRAPGQESTSRTSVNVTKDESPGPEIDGRASTRYDVKESFAINMAVEGQTLKAHVDAKGSVWVIDGRNDAIPFGLNFVLKSGVPNIDEQIAKRVGAKGLPLRSKMTVTRTIADGPPVTETMTVDIGSVKEAKHPDEIFTSPRDYTWREPTFGYHD
jgi:ribosomal protein L31